MQCNTGLARAQRLLYIYIYIYTHAGNQVLTSQTSIDTYIIFIGVGSSAALVLIISLTVLLCACACCYFKKKTIIVNEPGNKPQDNTAPIYEDVPPKRMNCQETDIDFETNVAYSTVKTMSYKI